MPRAKKPPSSSLARKPSKRASRKLRKKKVDNDSRGNQRCFRSCVRKSAARGRECVLAPRSDGQFFQLARQSAVDRFVAHPPGPIPGGLARDVHAGGVIQAE